jgi:hypothetical protein
VRKEMIEKGEYYLTYSPAKDRARDSLSIRFPSFKSSPFLVVGGRRSLELYKFLTATMKIHRIAFSLREDRGQHTLILPWATGHATAVFLLAVYATTKPLVHASFFEKMLVGSMPMARYFTRMTELALDASALSGDKEGSIDRLVTRKAARTVSKMMLGLFGLLNGAEERDQLNKTIYETLPRG